MWCRPSILMLMLGWSVIGGGGGAPWAAAADSQRWALLIGVNDYAELQHLRFCSKDMQVLATQLVTSGFPEKNVFLLYDEAKDKKYLPLKANIEKQLELVLKLAEPDDVVLVAFSGHGMHLDGKSYLCPTEADIESPERTMVAVDTLYDRLNGCRAAFKLLLVDACRDDPRPAGKRSATPKEDLQKLGVSFERPPEGILLLASCGPGQVSWEDEKLGHGVFMNYVVEGLGGQADKDKNGLVSLNELYEYAWRETKTFVARNKNAYQSPALRGELHGVFELGRAGPTPGSVITNSIGMKLTLVPAGEFLMGSGESPEELARAFAASDTKPEYFANEQPAHRVRIAKPFYLGVHEVTLGQFLKFYHEASYKVEAERDGKGGYGYTGETFEQRLQFMPWSWGFAGQTQEHPVVNVTWNDAVAFCEWLSRKEGKIYRLPTEAEWEYACRAKTTTWWYNGNDPERLPQVANVADASAKAKFPTWKWTIRASDGYGFSAPVGSFQANAFGLFDMHGNVWEFCADWYDQDYYAGSPTDDPQGPASGTSRVLRGGAWNFRPICCRSANRDWRAPAYRDYSTGFRVARTP